MVEQVDRLKGYRATGREGAIDLNFARVRHRLFLLEAWWRSGLCNTVPVVVVALVAFAGLTATVAWWERADQTG